MASPSVSFAIFVTRKPGMSPEDFKNHWENHHIPLLKKLAGPRFPTAHVRHYLARDSKSSDSAVRAIIGQPEDFTYDGFALVIFPSEAMFQAFVPVMSSPEVVEDEEKFTDREKLKVVQLGSIMVTKD